MKRYKDMERRTILATALILSLGSSAGAQAAGRCSRETLDIEGTPLTAVYCVTAVGAAARGHDLPVSVSESFSSPHGTWNGTYTFQFIAGEGSSRVIQDLPLEHVGLEGTLHLTLLLRGYTVAIDSAMLTPGAITVK